MLTKCNAESRPQMGRHSQILLNVTNAATHTKIHTRPSVLL